MAGPRSYKPQTGVRFPQLRQTHFPRSKVVSRPLKPVTLVRFQLGELCGGRGVLECTPRRERGGAGSIPAGHPSTTGCGSMAGHLARNQVHAGSIPAAQTEAAHERGRDAGLEMDQHQALWTTRQCRRPLKAQARVRLPAGSRRPIGLRGDGCRTFNPENGVRLPDGTRRPQQVERAQRYERRVLGSNPSGGTARFESAAEWSATGPENRGGGDEPQRFDSSTLV
jgi:hypothetical protein